MSPFSFLFAERIQRQLCVQRAIAGQLQLLHIDASFDGSKDILFGTESAGRAAQNAHPRQQAAGQIVVVCEIDHADRGRSQSRCRGGPPVRCESRPTWPQASVRLEQSAARADNQTPNYSSVRCQQNGARCGDHIVATQTAASGCSLIGRAARPSSSASASGEMQPRALPKEEAKDDKGCGRTNDTGTRPTESANESRTGHHD